MSFLQDPFFWALISAFGLIGSFQIVGAKKLGRHPLFGIVTVGIFALGRVVLVLPALSQPRFSPGVWNWIIGGLVFVAGMVFSAPALRIRPFTAPDQNIGLRATGFYALVRNPIYLGEILWSLGWSVMFGSVIGILLVPFWWMGLLSLTLIEEESLERELGQSYIEYKGRVRGRIIPGLPI